MRVWGGTTQVGLAFLLLSTVLVRGQQSGFSGMTHGVLLECDTPAPSGEFSIRASGSNQVYRFAFDAKTYVERQDQRVSMAAIDKGDTIEVVSDRDESAAVHYARTVHVIEARVTPPAPVSAGRYRLHRKPVEPYQSPVEWMAPRGDLTFSGVIARLTSDRLVLHARLQGEQTILLRGDTRYLAGGELVDRADLRPNTRVFVRAGKNLQDQVEAYQIIWGEILEPTHTQ